MRRGLLLFATMLLVLLPAGAGAQDGSRLDREPPPVADRTPAALTPFSASPLNEMVEVFVQLSEPSVAEVVAERGGNAPASMQQAQARRIEQQQARVARQLERFEADTIYQLRAAANGIAARVKVAHLAEVVQLPDVVSVAPIPLHEPHNATSVPWIGTPSVWEDLGLTGQGVSIAVIDSGIDYLHADLGGAGSATDYETNDPTTLADGGFPTAKVVGGVDLVGDDYNASSDDPAVNTPKPDPDPLDCMGHGTHVAGTAAGQGVLADGSAYTGPYDSTTFDEEFEIGPGVAPQALLYAVKVFGCAGSTAVTAQAIEWALDPNQDNVISDHVDVINMSLGSGFGSPDDATAIAASNAASVGVVVVASAGNFGDVPYVTGSPAVADGAISVAASIDGGITVGAMRVNSPESIAGEYEAAEGAITKPLAETGDVTGDLALAEPLRACTPLINSGEVAGKIAMIERGDCFFSTKILNAQAAGAVAVVVFNNVDGPPVTMAGDSTGIEIPGVMISKDDGATITGAMDSATVNVTLSADLEVPIPELADQLASFTSRGPGGSDTFKPDLAAPGFSIDSAAVGTGTKGGLSSGTSMAAPQVAGMGALLRESHGKELDTAVIKSILMNSTVPASIDYPMARQGVGVVRMDRAATLEAYTSPAGVSFGRLNPLAPSTVTETVTVTDLSGEARTYTVDVGQIQTPDGVSVTAPSAVTVPANGTASFDLTLTLDPDAMATDDGFFSQTEIDGRVALTAGDVTLTVGYVAVVDPAAAVAGTADPSQRLIEFTNDSSTGGLIDTFTLASEGQGALAAIGVRTRDIGTTPVVQFGVAQSETWDALSSWETVLLLDTDEDREFEFALVAADLGFLLGRVPDGRVVTALFDLVNQTGFLEWFVVADLNDRVQTLTVDRTGTFGFLAEDDDSFRYLALSFERTALRGVSEGMVNLAADADARVNFGTLLAPGETVALPLVPADRRLLALYQNNQAASQFQVLKLQPGRR